MGIKRAKALLKRTAIELVAGKELIREKKAKLKKAKDHLVIENTKLELETVQNAVRSIKAHRELLKQERACPSDG